MDAAMLGGGIAVAGVMAMFVRDALKDSDSASEPEHFNVKGGAAVAQTLEEVESQGLTSKRPGGFFISAVQAVKEKTARLLRYQQELGCLLFGAPGTGKGVGFVIPSILDRDTSTQESLLVFDTAAQNLHTTGGYLQSIGVRVLYSNLVGQHGQTLRAQFGAPGCMNPLGAVDIDEPLAELAIAETAGVLVPVKADEKASYFSGSAQQLVAGIATWLRESEGRTATWVKVAELVHASPWDMNQLFAAMKQSRFPKVRAIAARWYIEIDPETGKLKGTPTEGARDVLSTAQRELSFLLTGGIAEMFSGNFDFGTMKQERTAYFLVLPDSASEAITKCGYLVLRTAKQGLMTPGGFSVLMILDEMPAALPPVGAKLVQDIAALVRKYRIRIAGICQSWAQFQDWCGGSNAVKADALRGLFGAAIYYGANDNTSIQHILQECGSYTTWTPGTNPLHEAGINGNSAPLGVPLFQPEDIRAMISEGKQIINLIGARKCVVLPRANYRFIPEQRARAAEDIYHPKS